MRTKQHLKSAIRLLAVTMLFLSFSLTLSAQAIKFNFNKIPLKNVLPQIEQKTDFKFVYSSALKGINEKVSLQYELTSPQDIGKMLDLLFNGKDIYYQIKESTIVLIPGSQKQKVQENTAPIAKLQAVVSGTVVDESGVTMPGVFITNKTTKKNATSDINGKYSITANEGDVLTFSFIGMKEGSTVVGKNSVINIAMQEDAIALGNVVVTGYQSISKERSAGSYDIIKGDDIAVKSLNTNSVIDGLEGLTTGLSISHNEGADKYLIRGTTSLNSTRSPLFVVDGIPMNEDVVEDMINSNDIESVTVLKDATAASIWGSQAANGVIVITTKRGENNQKVQVAYNGSFTYYGKPDYSYYKLMDSKTFMKNAQELFDIYSEEYSYEDVQTDPYNAMLHSLFVPAVMPHEEIMYQYKEGMISQSERDQKLNYLIGLNGREQYEQYFMSDKLFTQHNVSLRGGSNKHTYFLSMTYKGDQGTKQDWTDKISVNAYQDFKITDWLKWDMTVNFSLGNKNSKLLPWDGADMTLEEYESQMNYGTGAIYSDVPYNIFRDANGWVDQAPMVISSKVRSQAEEATEIGLGFYPVEDFNNSISKNMTSNIRVNTGLTVNLLKGLRYEGRFQYSRINNKLETFRSGDSYYVREERVMTYDPQTDKLRLPSTGGHYSLSNSVASDWTLRNQLMYDSSFNDDKHQITALAGTEIRSYLNTAYNNSLRGYNMQTMLNEYYNIDALIEGISPTLFSGDVSVRTDIYSQSELKKKYFSLYANAAYTYNHKYTLNASIRMDQSNLFGSDPSTQYKPIWSVGAAWRIAEEDFMQNVNAINDLTIRASYGFAGNSPLPGTGGKYDLLEAVSSSSYETPGYNVMTPANDLLTWEKTRTVNVGFDIRMLSNRIALSFDYYDKYTKDLIGIMNLNPTTGWLSTTGNLGEMSNKGFELSLTTNNIRSRNFNWNTILTLSHNKNNIEKLDVETPIDKASDLLGASYVEGYPMGAMFSYRYAGLDENGRPQAFNKDGEIVTETDLRTLTKDDVVYSGTTIPKFYGGLTNILTYKNFELSFLFVYNFGHKMRKDGIVYADRLSRNLPMEYDNRWREPGDEEFTDIPRYMETGDYYLNQSVYYSADTRVLDASYIKLRDLSLSYTLPGKVCKKIGTESIKLTAQFGNLFLIPFNDQGIDPEAYSLRGGTYLSRGEKFGPSYSFGININF